MSIRVNGKVIASNGDVKTETDNLVTTDTNQTIIATKVITAEQQRKSTVIDITTQPENYIANNAFRFLDKNDQISGYIENGQMASGEITTGIHATNKDGYQPRVSVFTPLSGTTGAYAIAPITPEDAPIDAITTKSYVDSKTGGLELLDIAFAPLGIDESKNKRRYLNGQVLIQEQFPAFTAAVKARMTTMANAFTTEVNWQAEKTNSKLGQCGKFVVDDTAGTIRLPCVVNINGLVDLANCGMIKNESLPNITGTGYFAGTSGQTTGSGAFSKSVLGAGIAGTSAAQYYKPYLDASDSSSTYQDNAPVQQEAVQYPYIICVNSGVNEAERPINNYQVNNVYSYGMSQYYKGVMNNNSWLRSQGQWNDGTVYTGVYTWAVEQMNVGVAGFVASTAEYTDYDWVIDTADQTFRLPLLNGQEGVFADGVKGNGIGIGLSTAGGPQVMGGQSLNGQNDYSYYLCSNPQDYGKTVGTAMSGFATQAANSIFGLTEETGKSGIIVDKTVPSGYNLYFYIGDTLQNADLINIARLGEQITDLSARRYVTETWKSGTSWYRIWSDGWIEQGGETDSTNGETISFLKTFTEVPFVAVFAKELSTNSSAVFCALNSITLTNFVYQSGGWNNSGQLVLASGICVKKWYACGY